MNKKIGIVTVLFNSSDVLEDYFNTLDSQTNKSFILYIVDNNSSDKSLEIARKKSLQVSFKTVFLPQQENYGVAKGNNIGIKHALEDKCDYVLLSNNDIVLEQDTIDILYNGMIANKASMAVPKIYYWNSDKVIWQGGGRFLRYKAVGEHFGYRMKDINNLYDREKLIEYSSTCFMLIDSSVFSRVGLMDEDYFVYYDDADFVWRSTVRKNERLFYIPTSIVWHKEGYSTGGTISDFTLFYTGRNKIYFARKHFTFFQRLILYSYLVIHYFLRDIYTLNSKQRKALCNGFIEGRKLAKSYESRKKSHR